MTDWSGVFTDLAVAQEATYLKDAGGFLNEASTRTHILGKAIKGSANKGIKTIQGGKDVREQYFDTYTDTVVDWSPDSDTFDLPNPQFLKEHGIPWRFTAVPLTWSDPEVELNPDTTEDGMQRQLTDLFERKRQHMKGNLMEQLDARMLATPDYATMEGDGAQKVYSLPALITEENSGGVPMNWTGTTIQGLDTATHKNQVGTYDYIDGDAAGSDLSLFEAMDDMILKVQFNQYPEFDAATPSDFEPSTCILTSRLGRRAYQKALRASNDGLVTTSRQDPAYMKPAYAGQMIEHIERLGTNALYDGGSGTFATEAAATVKGPRFMFWNSEFLCPIWHANRYMFQKKPGPWGRQPFRNVIWYDTWWQQFLRSKRRQGIVSPSASITTITA